MKVLAESTNQLLNEDQSSPMDIQKPRTQRTTGPHQPARQGRKKRPDQDHQFHTHQKTHERHVRWQN